MRFWQGEWNQGIALPQVPLGIIAASVPRLRSMLLTVVPKALCSLVLTDLSAFIHSLLSNKHAKRAPTPGASQLIFLCLDCPSTTYSKCI